MNTTLSPATETPSASSSPALPAVSARKTASPLRLLLNATGGPFTMTRKLGRLVAGLWTLLWGRRLRDRLERLKTLGHVEQTPTRMQLAVGSVDMLRFWISPAAADYYTSQGISYGFHQILRFCDDPLSVTDPLGFLSERDTIIGHLMQVVHANPVYDLQLLESYEDGLDQLELQLEQMLDGTHPRAASIGAIVEEPTYHAELLAFVRVWREDRSAPPMLRANVAESAHWSALEATFGQLPSTLRYFCTLPTSLRGALRHVRTVKAFTPPA